MGDELTVIQAPPELEQDGCAIMSWARSLSIVTPVQYAEAGDQLKTIKAVAKRVEDFFGPMKRNAAATHKAICARENELLKPLGDAEKLAKAAMVTYTRAEEEKRIAEQRRLQAIADEAAMRERQKAEAEAARQRQLEAEARAKAEAARKAAEEASAAERKKLLAAAAAADRKAEAASIKAEAQVETAAAVMAPVVQIASRTEKVAGLSTRKAWKFRVVNPLLVPREFLIIDEQRLQKYAAAMKEQAQVAGVEFYTDDILSARGKA